MSEKRKRHSADGPASTSLLLPESQGLDSLRNPFPRGGGADISPLDIKKAGAEATRDVFDQVARQSSGRKSKKSKVTGQGLTTATQKPTIATLQLSKMRVGTTVLGLISEVHPYKLTISLPNSIIGFVDFVDDEDSSDNSDLAALYKPGQWLRVTVVDLGPAPVKRLQLSIDPELVNQSIESDDFQPGMAVQGTIKSLEDHGAIVAFGPGNEFTGFIPKSKLAFKVSERQTVLATVIKTKGKVLQLTTKSDHPLLKTVHQQASLVPGTLVSIQPSETTRQGRHVTIFGHLDASIDRFQVVEAEDPSDGLIGRVIFSIPSDNITQLDRILGLSVLPHVLESTVPALQGSLKTGQMIDAAKVVSVDPRSGLFLDIGLDRPAFAHISRLADDRIEDLSTEPKFKVNTVHKARIIGYSPVDDLFQLTLEPKVLAQKYVNVEEIPVGDIVEAKVDRILVKGGVVVTLGEGLNGLVPEQFLSDVKLANPERKYKPGQAVNARVLSVEQGAKRFKLTLKKSILTWDGAIITGIPDAVPGIKTIGTIVALKKTVAILEHFGGVKSILPFSELLESMQGRPESHLWVGQSQTVYVISADSDDERLIVSMRSPGTSSAAHIQPLDFVEAIITEKTPDSFILDIEGARGTLTFQHLTDVDSSSKVKKEAARFKVGSKIKEILVLERSKSSLVVTLKPSLVQAAKEGNLPSELTSFAAGKQYSGFIRNTLEGVGAFVGFANNISGLLPAIELGETSFKPGSSVAAYVSRIDSGKQRITLSLKPKEVTQMGELAPGTVTNAIVTSVKSNQLNVDVSGRRGRIEVSEIFDSYDEIQDAKHPTAQFSIGDTVAVKIIGFHDARTHKFLPLSHRGGTKTVLELTAKKSLIESDEPVEAIHSPAVGTKVLSFVNNVADTGDALWVNLTPELRAKLAVVDLATSLEEAADLGSHWPSGSAIESEVVATSPALRLSALSAAEWRSPVVCRVLKVMPTSVVVAIPFSKPVLVACTDSLDKFEPLATKFVVGSYVLGRFLADPNGDEKALVSLRPSVVYPDAPAVVDDKLMVSPSDIQAGDVLHGFVKNIADAGLFVALGRDAVGRALISQLSDEYLKDWKSAFKVGEVIKVKVLSRSGNRLDLSLKQSVVSGESKRQKSIQSLAVGEIFEGTVRRIVDFGIFVNFAEAGLVGLCHKKEVSDRQIKDLDKLFQEGDHVKVMVLKVEPNTGRISLGMKASYFEQLTGGDDSDDDMEDGDVSVEMGEDGDDDDDEENVEDDEDKDILEIDDLAGLDSSNDSAEVSSDSEDEGATASTAAGLSAKFDLSGVDFLEQVDNNDASSDSDSESDDDAPRRKKRRQQFVEDKTASLNSQSPQSVQDFERLLVANPNSSVLWMNYMAFQVQLSEIDAARQIAQRALRTIDIRDEEQKTNIWVALLNLEASFGSPESTQETFQKAIQHMDALGMHLKMASIYAASGLLDEARTVFNSATKRFGSASLQLWLEFISFLFDNGNADGARTVLEKGTRQLPSRYHKELTINFATQEYQKGDPERGRTLFEALVAANPKKTDVWSVYLDQEIKLDPRNRKVIEALFERMLQQKLSPKQGKSLFKKWLSYELDHGDAKGADYVKAKAAQFVNELSKH